MKLLRTVHYCIYIITITYITLPYILMGQLQTYNNNNNNNNNNNDNNDTINVT